jgi:hypothetical protein
MIDRLPLDVLFVIIRRQLRGRDRVILRSVCRELRKAVLYSYPLEPTICVNLKMDLVDAMDSSARFALMETPGSVRLFYVYHPAVRCYDILFQGLFPDLVSVNRRNELMKKLTHWIPYVDRGNRLAIAAATVQGLLGVRKIGLFQRLYAVLRSDIWSWHMTERQMAQQRLLDAHEADILNWTDGVD